MNAIYSLFPKFYSHLSPPQLADLVREAGLDTTQVVVREGYWVTPGELKRELPAFVRTMRDQGLDIRFVTSDFKPDELLADPTPLEVMAELGLTHFRLNHFRDESGDPRRALAERREQLQRLVPLCREHGLRCVYQIHHQTLIPNASAAWLLVQDLPADAIGIQLDPGNQAREGFERWSYAAPLLKEYLVSLGVKDAVPRRKAEDAEKPNKGWGWDWATLDAGITDWHACLKALAGVGFDGYFEFMPFCNDSDPPVMTEKLKQDVAYLRRVQAALPEGGDQMQS